MIKKWFRQVLFALLCAAMLISSLPAAQAQESGASKKAEAIDAKAAITDTTGFDAYYEDRDLLFDGRERLTLVIQGPISLTFTHPEGIGSAYLIFDQEFQPYTVLDPETGKSHIFGKEGYLHDFADIEGIFGYAPESLTFSFEGTIKLNELYLFTPGEVPAAVQKWGAPENGKVDLMLFPTHGDDEQLFFAGLLPYYGAQRNYEVLVVYLTNHFNTQSKRTHEMLDGLWAVGMTNYPVFGQFGDYYCKSIEDSYQIHARKQETPEDMQAFIVEQLRRYQPQVAVGHDLLHGEYGHGQHMMYADLLVKGIESAEDETLFPESAQQWGTWSVPKTYLHLWPENPVVLDLDQPLSRFDNMTAYEVSKHLGFPAHLTQVDNFAWYMHGIDQARDIKKYSPCEYGLYRTTIGPDTQKNDLFENLTSYAEQEAIALAAAAETIPETAPPAETPATTQAPALPSPVSEETPATSPPFISWMLAAFGALLILSLMLGFFILRKKKHPPEANPSPEK